MKDVFTAPEIAAALGAGDRHVRRRARAERWPVAGVHGRNHVCCYRVADLPADVRFALARQAVAETPAPAVLVNGAAAALKPRGAKAQARAAARLELLRASDLYLEAAALPAVAALAAFSADYAAGRIAIAPAVRTEIGAVSPSSLRRWRCALETSGIAALSGRYGARKGRSKIAATPEIAEFVAALIAAKPHAKASHVIAAIRARFGRDRAPAYRTLQRYLAGSKAAHEQELLALANPDAAKGRHMPAFGSESANVTRLNERWEMDSTPADVMLADGRHSIIAVLDILTRRGKLLVSKTSRAAAIAALSRRAILDWGVPEEVITDNGQDYVSRHLLRAFADLQIRHRAVAPFSPEKKPHVERFIGTFTHDLVELLPNYIGHDVAEVQALRARQSFAERFMTAGEAVEITMGSEELQTFCDRWCDEVYAHAPHKGLGGKTPFAAAAAWRGQVRRIADERALDVLLSAAPGHGYRVVGKKGIALDGAFYIAAELGALIGRRVQVLYDDGDLGRIYVFDADDGAFICIAEDPARTGMDRRAVAIEARRRWKAATAALRKAARQSAKAHHIDGIAQEILDDARSQAANLVAFPQATLNYETPALAEAAKAARGQAQALSERQALIDTFAGVSPSVGALYALEAEGNFRFLCSATAVGRHDGQTVILTAYHCAMKGVSYYVNFGDQVLRRAQIWKVPHYEVDAEKYPRIFGEPETDMALFLMAGEDVPVAAMAESSAVANGTKVAMVGYPLGLSKIMYEGIVAGRFDRPGDDMYDYLLLQIFGAPGSSGSAVVDVDSGEIVGVLVAATRAIAGLPVIFATPIDYSRWLREVLPEDAGEVGGNDSPPAAGAEER